MSGFKKPLVVLSYNNCELYCFHLDGYKNNTEELITRLNEIENIINNKPLNSKFRIWYNLDDNKLNSTTMKLISESICRFNNHIYKIAFIGLSGYKKVKFNSILKKAMKEKKICYAYFTDAELAKGWLV